MCPTQEQMDNAFKYLKKITSEQDAASSFLDQPEKYLATSALRHEKCKCEQTCTIEFALGLAMLCFIGMLMIEIINGRRVALKLLLLALCVGWIYGAWGWYFPKF